MKNKDSSALIRVGLFFIIKECYVMVMYKLLKIGQQIKQYVWEREFIYEQLRHDAVRQRSY